MIFLNDQNHFYEIDLFQRRKIKLNIICNVLNTQKFYCYSPNKSNAIQIQPKINEELQKIKPTTQLYSQNSHSIKLFHII